MTKLKLILVTLFTLTLAACGSPEPLDPFQGKWALDKEMTLQKNRDMSAEVISYFQDMLQILTYDISDSEINIFNVYSLSRPDNKRKVRDLFAKPDATRQPEDDTIRREMKASYKFGEHTGTVKIEAEGQKKIVSFEFTFIADPAKLTLKFAGDDDVGFPSVVHYLREGEYMIVKAPMGDVGKMVALYFTKQEN